MPRDAVRVRVATEADLSRIASIQAVCAEAAHWEVRDYLVHDLAVAEHLTQVVGFVVVRPVAPGESEILNLAVDPGMRREGVGQALVEWSLKRHPGAVFLEVRESNQGAQKFYQAIGFKVVGYRSEYYEQPSEGAVVMNFHSC